MPHKRLALIVPSCFLAIVSLACSILPGGASISSLQATANAALTQAASTAAASIRGSPLGATATAASTQALATATAGAGQPTAVATLASTGPQDVPLVDPHTVVSTSDVELVYNTTADIPTVVKFYQDQMPKLGWAAQGAPYVTASIAKLGFTKTSKSMVLAISIDPTTKQTVVDALIE